MGKGGGGDAIDSGAKSIPLTHIYLTAEKGRHIYVEATSS